ncbi:MAG: aldehyde dehydrogenase family protein [Bacillota bacterium]
MDIKNQDINKIVEQILKEIDKDGLQDQNSKTDKSSKGDLGIFPTMDEAIAAAYAAQNTLQDEFSIEEREDLIKAMRNEISMHVDKISRMAYEESGMGRIEDKISKNNLAINKTPGTEDLRTEAKSGKKGLTILEEAPFGVICAITPVTNPTETIICNSIGMIAACNTIVFNAHPKAKKTSTYVIKVLNQAIIEAGGPANLLTAVSEPTIQTVESCMADDRIAMIVATGGPGVVKAALSSGKKAIGAGAGNPPVLVDDTVDLKRAAADIIQGASFDNNLPCTSEKVIVALESVADELLKHMTDDNAQLIDDPAPLEKIILNDDGSINKDLVGKNAAYILRKAGLKPKCEDLRIAVVDVELDHPFVQEEQLMPVIPLVRAKNFKEAMEMGVQVEHGNRHTAVIHSKNVDNLTAFAKKIETTIYVKNAPSYAGIGAGGEGHTTFTIAGPTGEGLTSARTFTRKRRCVLVDGFSII